MVYIAPPPNARLAAQKVEPTLVMHQGGGQRGGPRQGGVGDPCGRWYYGTKSMPPGAHACLRCFPPPAETADEDVPPAQAEERYDQRESSSSSTVAESLAESGSDASAAVEVD